MTNKGVKDNQVGLGLRVQHYQEIVATKPDVDWFEAISENYMVQGGTPLHYLDQVAALYPIVLHGVSLSIGSHDPLNQEYLQKLKTLANRVSARWISDHLCWTGVHHTNTHDLLPMPLTEESLSYVCSRIDQVQSLLGREIVLENPSTYLQFKEDEYQEWDFLSALCKRTGCYLLLDVNNLYVNSQNHQFDCLDYISALPLHKVAYIHLAGHIQENKLIIDTHDMPVSEEVWHLYQTVLQAANRNIPTMIERDDNIPPLAELLKEVAHVRHIQATCHEVETACL